MKQQRFLKGFAIVCLFLAGCASTPTKQDRVDAIAAPQDMSVASNLYRAEAVYQASRSDEDAIGMAKAIRERLIVLDFLERDRRFRNDTQRALLKTTRIMKEETRAIAQNDKDTLSEVERLFAMDTNTSRGNILGGAFGKIGKDAIRKVDVTVGMEIDVYIEGGGTKTFELPVSRQAGTTIFVEPSRGYIGDSPELALQAWPSGGNSSKGCETASDGGRLACFLPAGKHVEIDLVLTNHSTMSTNVIVFVSGDARSVGAALADE